MKISISKAMIKRMMKAVFLATGNNGDDDDAYDTDAAITNDDEDLQ